MIFQLADRAPGRAEGSAKLPISNWSWALMSSRVVLAVTWTPEAYS